MRSQKSPKPEVQVSTVHIQNIFTKDFCQSTSLTVASIVLMSLHLQLCSILDFIPRQRIVLNKKNIRFMGFNAGGYIGVQIKFFVNPFRDLLRVPS